MGGPITATRVERARLVAAALIATITVAGAGCGRPSATLAPYTNERFGFVISAPASYQRVETQEGYRQWFLPTALPAGEFPETVAADFIVVMSLDQPGPLSENEVRRLAMTLLPMHGVSGFQRMASSTSEVAWYHFELTGSTAGREWASVGLLITGPQRLHYVVCAAPLADWRLRQKLCDDVLRSFKPGTLAQ